MAAPALSNPADKSTVHFIWRTAALSPVENKFGPREFNKLCADTVTQHDIHGISTRLPVSVERFGFVDFEGVML